MRGLFRLALFAGAVSCGSIAAVAAPITGELNLTGDGGVNFGGGTATMAFFSAMGAGQITAGNQTGSFAELGPCSACVTFGSLVGVPAGHSGQTQYTVGPLISTTGNSSDTTYTHGPVSGLPLFALNDSGLMSSFTPEGTLTIDKVTTVVAGRRAVSYILNAMGTLTLSGFDPTQGTFMITTQGNNSFASFSATADAAPAPLAGAGLLSFGGAGMVALRKRGRRLLGQLLGRLSSRLAMA